MVHNNDASAGTNKPEVVVFAVQNRPKRTRASAPRSRNGCRQCKIRHAKCDESRPSCKGCVTRGLVCDGYWVTSHGVAVGPRRDATTTGATAAPVQIRPRSSVEAAPADPDADADAHGGSLNETRMAKTHARVARLDETRMTKTPPYLSLLFEDGKQFNLFQLFIYQCSQDGSLPTAQLISLTPQIAQAAGALRHLCCGVAALMASATNFDGSGFFEAGMYEESVRQCNLAVQSLRAVKLSLEGIKITLVAGLLFTTYEVAHGNIEAAFAHFEHANRMMEQYIDLKCREEGVSFESLRLDPLETAIFDMLQRLTAYPWSSAATFRALKTNKLDQKIRACCRGRKHRYLVQDMPTQFDDLTAASRWWDITQHYIKHQLHEGVDPEHDHDTASSVSVPSSGSASASPSTSESTSESTAGDPWTRCLDVLLTWRIAFLPLLRHATAVKASQPRWYLQVLTLNILYHEAMGGARSRRSGDANVLPSTLPMYREMWRATIDTVLRDEKGVIADPSSMQIASIAFIAYKCRDRALLAEIRAFLNSTPSRDPGIWALMDSVTSKEKQFRIRASERAWTWYFASIGCGSGDFVNT